LRIAKLLKIYYKHCKRITRQNFVKKLFFLKIYRRPTEVARKGIFMLVIKEVGGSSSEDNLMI